MFTDAVGELVAIQPEELMPVVSPHWRAAPSKIIGMILEVEKLPWIGSRPEARVHVITHVPGLASRICWLSIDKLEFLNA